MSATLREIVNDAQGIIGEVAGPGVQMYGEDRMMRDTIRAFNLLFKRYHWDQYMKWLTLTLDGTLGIITTDALEWVLDFEDILTVHRAGRSAELPVLSKRINPNVITGNGVRFWSSLHVTDANYKKRKIQFWPRSSIGDVDIHARVYPKDPGTWAWADTIYLDRDMLAYGTAFMTLMADDLNPAAAATTQGLMDMRYSDIMNALGSRPMSTMRDNNIPTTWSER